MSVNYTLLNFAKPVLLTALGCTLPLPCLLNFYSNCLGSLPGSIGAIHFCSLRPTDLLCGRSPGHYLENPGPKQILTMANMFLRKQDP